MTKIRKLAVVVMIILTSGCSYIAPAFHCSLTAVANPRYAGSACRTYFNDVTDEDYNRCMMTEVWTESNGCMKYASK